MKLDLKLTSPTLKLKTLQENDKIKGSLKASLGYFLATMVEIKALLLWSNKCFSLFIVH